MRVRPCHAPRSTVPGPAPARPVPDLAVLMPTHALCPAMPFPELGQATPCFRTCHAPCLCPPASSTVPSPAPGHAKPRTRPRPAMPQNMPSRAMPTPARALRPTCLAPCPHMPSASHLAMPCLAPCSRPCHFECPRVQRARTYILCTQDAHLDRHDTIRHRECLECQDVGLDSNSKGACRALAEGPKSHPVLSGPISTCTTWGPAWSVMVASNAANPTLEGHSTKGKEWPR